MLAVTVGEVDIDAVAILLDALERIPKMIVLSVDRLQQGLPQVVPGCDDLELRLFGNGTAVPVERDALVDDDTDINGARAAFVQRLEQFQMGSEDSDATTDQLD